MVLSLSRKLSDGTVSIIITKQNNVFRFVVNTVRSVRYVITQTFLLFAPVCYEIALLVNLLFCRILWKKLLLKL